MKEYELKINEEGHPCRKDCCNNPTIVTPEHEHNDKEFCEECYGSECENCGQICYCDL